MKRTIQIVLIAFLFVSCFTEVKAQLTQVNKNYTIQKVYDENGQIISYVQEYKDKLGRTEQVQSLNLQNSNVVMQQTVFDKLGRPALNTLPAPIYQDSTNTFRSDFIKNAAGNEYSYTDFDLQDASGASGEIHNPAALSSTGKGSLGWYYSNNNNEEAYVPFSSFPYFRNTYSEDPGSNVIKIGAAGEHLRMGSGHVKKVFYTTTNRELAYIIGEEQIAYKSIAIDEEGLEEISFTDDDGKVVARCFAGLTSSQNCLPVTTTARIVYNGQSSVDVHVPLNGSLHIIRNFNHTNNIGYCVGDGYGGFGGKILYELTDLSNGYRLVEGSDYTIDYSGGGTVSFLGDYAGESRYLRIAVNHPQSYINCLKGLDSDFDLYPIQTVEVSMDYSDWTLYEYDNKGNLTTMLPPKAINCSNYDPTVEDELITGQTSRNIGQINSTNTAYLSSNNTFVFESDDITVDPSKQTQTYEYLLHVSMGGTAARTPHTLPTCDYPEPPQKRIYVPGGVEEPGSEITGEPGEGEAPNNPEYESYDLEELEEQIREEFQASRVDMDPMDAMYFEDNSSGLDYPSIFEEYADTLSSVFTPDTNLYNFQRTHRLNQDEYDISSISNSSWADIVGGDVCSDPRRHCRDKIMNCDETGVDEGGSCEGLEPGWRCEGLRNLVRGRFRIVLESEGLHDTRGWETVDIMKTDENAPPTSTMTFEGKLIYNCDCTYWLEEVGVHQIENKLDHNYLLDYSKFRFRLKEVYYAPNFALDPYSRSYRQAYGAYSLVDWNDPIEDLVHTVKFSVLTKHEKTRIVDQPYHDYTSATTFSYNANNQKTQTTSPDEGTNRFYYDDFRRLKFWQNAAQAAADEYSYLDYDRSGRIIERGVIASASLPTALLNERVGSSTGYTLSERHKVEYDKTGSNFPFAAYAAQTARYHHRNLNGRVTKTSNDASSTWYGYDERGRLKWTIQYIPELDKHISLNYMYHANGNVFMLIYQWEEAGEMLIYRYSYDNNARLTKVETSTDNTNFKEHAEYSYYQHGPLKRMELGDDLQGVDYVYTINGWLKSINNPELSRDPGQDGAAGDHAAFAQDVFGMTLDYFRNDYQRNATGIQSYSEHYYQPYYDPETETFSSTLVILPSEYNGTVNSMRWKTRTELDASFNPTFEGKQLVYIPQYDKRKRITEALFGTISSSDIGVQNTGTAVPVNTYDGPSPVSQNDYKVWNIQYDLHGNINSLNRNGSSALGLNMDQLTMTRSTTGNRLLQVADAHGQTMSIDLPNQAANNYAYDAAGRMIADVAENNYLNYNSNNLTTTIFSNATKTTKKSEFVYDERGQRLFKSNYNGGASPVSRQYYIRDANGLLITVLNANASNQITATDYQLYGSSQLGYYDRSSDLATYQLSDHLGNVRATIKEVDNSLVLESAQDYYPFGSRMPGRIKSPGTFYRLGYQGQQEEEETGFNAFELRLYDARIGGWLSPDPYRQHLSPYMAMSNNPLSFIDPDGGYDFAGGGDEDDPDGCDDCPDLNGPLKYDVMSMINQIIENGADWWQENYGSFYSSLIDDIEDGKYFIYGEYDLNIDGKIFPVQRIKANPFYIQTNLEWNELDNLIGRNGGDMAFAGAIAIPAAESSALAASQSIPIAGAVLLAAYSAEQLERRASELTFVTYTKRSIDGRIYIGRTSGYGDPATIVARRDAGHKALDAMGFLPAVVDVFMTGVNTPMTGDGLGTGVSAYVAIRGREQQLIDANGGVGSFRVANRIRGVSRINPLGRLYHGASSLFFGEVAPYSGF